VVLNPSDQVSLNRIINVPNRGIGATSHEKLVDWANQNGTTLYEALQKVDQIPGLTPGCRKACAALIGLFEKSRDQFPTFSPSAAMTHLLEASGYLQSLEEEVDTDPEAAGRLDNLQELVNALKEYEETHAEATLSDYLQGVALQSSADTYDSDAPSVTLMTIHLAKGLEFPVVFLTGLEEGLFPIGAGNTSPEELEEERRLCYVGMTRAKERLHLCYASTRRIFGQTYSSLPSRFILEANLTTETAAPVAAIGSPEPRTHAGQAPAAPRGPSAIKSGSKVRHPSFGRGVVMSLSGSGEAAKVTVRFDSGIVKKLLLRYAPLEVI
jgi:DNA helicase-2/ATP-dependent DNA helicase PcrA